MKRPFSLLEVVIAMTLTSLLLTGLFSSYRHMTLLNLDLQKVREERRSIHLTRLRLTQIFAMLPATTVLTLKENRLTFSLHNPLDADPNFCGQLEATLSSKETLSLTLKKESQERSEIFKARLENGSIALFDPKQKAWVKEAKSLPLPPALKLTIGKEEFLFPLSQSVPKVELS